MFSIEFNPFLFMHVVIPYSMAPTSRSRGKPRRGGARELGKGTRGSGQGRGRATQRTNLRHKNAFKSTRIDDEPADSSEINDVESDSLDEKKSEEDLGASSDSDGSIQAETIPPYNSLLQSLTTNIQRGAPQRKKRKLDSADETQEAHSMSEFKFDEVEEPEEVEAIGTDDSDVEEQEQNFDPFIKHVELNTEVLESFIQAVKSNNWSTSRPNSHSEWSHVFQLPQIPTAPLGSGPSAASNTEALFLKQKLQKPAKKLFEPFNNLTRNLAFSIFHYRDVLFPCRTSENGAILRKLTCLHGINHIFKTRDKVIKDNARLTKDNAELDLELRDQGFTRPKVLFLLPTRRSCVNYVETIISLCEPEQQENKKRFQESYASGERVSEDKPQDFQELFNGNDDDMFRLGLKFTRKTVKYFAHFYNSDIIFASPLGLRMALGADDPKRQDSDFLSSIEIVVVDQADAVLMQNWEHIEYIFDRLNLQPKEAHGCDFSRVRNWYLDGNARYLRQTVLLSTFNFPSLNRLYAKHMFNVAGRLKYSRAMDGAMTDLEISLKQTFLRFDFSATTEEPENRFRYFTTTVVPSLTKASRQDFTRGQGVLIYLPSYVDFVRVRNYLATSAVTQNISFGSISEYAPARDVARARSHFLSGRHSVLLYTERAHHFRRYHLKGVKRVVMYGLPENPIFYNEIIGGFLGASVAAAKVGERETNVKALFSRLDILKLERIVGSARYLSMLKEKGGDIFDFV